MEVILQQNYPSLGFTGDIVKVRRGFARNFLLPRGIALDISAKNSKALKHRVDAINAKKAKIKVAAEEEAAKLSQVALDFTIKVGKGGKLFGAITARDVEKALSDKGISVDRRQIKLTDAMKKVGTYEVKIKLHSDVTATIKLNLKADKLVTKSENASNEEISGKKLAKAAKARKAAAAEGTEPAAVESAEKPKKARKSKKQEA